MIEILNPACDGQQITDLRSSDYRMVDAWTDALPELRELDRFSDDAMEIAESDLDDFSRYVVYPWRRTVVRLPDASLFYRLRTARNRYLITEREQSIWSGSAIAVAGLSVGASALHVCAITGARNLRIADPDTLGATNLNRLAGSVCDLGTPKTVLAQRRILELDPYSSVQTFPRGYSPDSASEFLGCVGGHPTARVVLEEMDNIEMKIDLRLRARSAGIPVIMVTDDGDNVIVDVERYDLDRDYPLFHGRAGDLSDLNPSTLRDPRRRVDLVSKIVGNDITPRTKTALSEVGRSIPSWPQLGTAATLAGAVGATVARMLVCGDEVTSGRCHVRIDHLLPG